MKRRIIRTSDGSNTIQIEDWNEQYHSKHGAVQEAYHVFIKHGLYHLNLDALKILEIGFGTGLNSLITLIESNKLNRKVYYTGVEKYPIDVGLIKDLDYIGALDAAPYKEQHYLMHQCHWNAPVEISPQFVLRKQQKDFLDITDKLAYHLIYFDAFGARVQPELWTVPVFKIMFEALVAGGVLVTYSAKGSVRRAMLEVGFQVERLAGPPGKREMLRATKINS
ncbi:Hypothetical protein I595_3240 [Croceitalea dokdonensis DOKDO 023]|uniref:MnmC-like methyltransferase domain-containing protein n=1 Tax=Croceitalea dokdonensis DOKDO 023 TaxID=1300341 RepID=A0A0P7AC13_9FLAO|nr:tRNA (5-methylaminomethyl-2-thiouridine)(34)-methyltransferase MnmD [Croceitalea dokdonensis]KPM30743.1 Hypothetical protein I595_3240 [Croceitalea dokdonensis DOKDO 023]